MAIAPNGEKLIVHTSNFRPVKRVEDVVQVFKLIHDQTPSKLLLIGDGPERARMEQLCRSLHISEDVRFLGKLEAVEEVLSVADLFLLPSEQESFGLAALEAMACQVPVISSDTEGLPEINVHGVTGFMSKVGDVEDMARNSLYILSDPEVHKRFKHAAYTHAKKFDLNNIMLEYEEVYEGLVVKA